MKIDKGKILILLGFLFTLYLRVNLIENKNMWFDEIYSWNTSLYDIAGIIKAAAGDIHPPLFYIVLKGWTAIFSDSVFAMRSLSVFFSILSLVFIYRISKDILKDDVKVFAIIILYALSPVNIHYAQEVRMFMMNTFLCLGSVYYFMILLQNRSKRASTLFILFSVFAIYTHYFAFLVILTEGLIVLYRQIRAKSDFTLLKTFTPLFIIILLSYIPWFSEFFGQVSKGQSWRTPQDFSSLTLNTFAFFREIFFSYFIYYKSASIYHISNYVTLSLVIIYCILFVIMIKRKEIIGDTAVVTTFFAIPMIIAVIISYKNSLLLSRYISIIIPFFIMSYVIFALSLKNKKISYTIITFFILVSAVGTKFEYEMDFKNNDYRQIIQYLEKNYHDGDYVVVEPHYMGWSIKYLNKREETNLPAPIIIDYSLKGIVDSLNNNKSIENLWLVLDYSSLGRDGYDNIVSSMNAIGFDMKQEETFIVIPEKVMIYYFVRR